MDDIADFLVERTVPAHALRRPPSGAEAAAAEVALASPPFRLSVVWET